MLKLYTSCINQFLPDHCEINKIVTTQQAGGKKDVDCVPHEWLLIALKLAKVPPLVISAIGNLILKWSTNLHLTSHEGDI